MREHTRKYFRAFLHYLGSIEPNLERHTTYMQNMHKVSIFIHNSVHTILTYLNLGAPYSIYDSMKEAWLMNGNTFFAIFHSF